VNVPMIFKIIGAVLLALCLALPADKFDSMERDSWTVILLFTWPLLTLAALQWKPKGNAALAIRIVEVLFVAFSIYVVWSATKISTVFPEIFGIVDLDHGIARDIALGALGLYGVGAISRDVALVRRWRKRCS